MSRSSSDSSSSLVRTYKPVPRRRQDRTKEVDVEKATNGWLLAFDETLYGQDRFRYDLENLGLKIVPSRVKNLEHIYLIIGDCNDDTLMRHIKDNLKKIGGAILMNVRSQNIWKIDLFRDDEEWGAF